MVSRQDCDGLGGPNGTVHLPEEADAHPLRQLWLHFWPGTFLSPSSRNRTARRHFSTNRDLVGEGIHAQLAERWKYCVQKE
jgi:hypothetical protein